ncbi:MAG TPA: hypothetical protein VKU82_02825 [Planctomycetaceae bacterium]|nr:hypothetical protein [Planctomycetaceae bacterium]
MAPRAREAAVAVLDVVSSILFLIPRTRPLGLLLVSAYLGGAIATHVQHDDLPLGPAVILSMVWAATWLRNPQIVGRTSKHRT